MSMILVLYSMFLIFFSFDASDDLRMNPFNEKGNYVIQTTLKYLFQVSIGLVIKLRAKRFKYDFNGLLQNWT